MELVELDNTGQEHQNHTADESASGSLQRDVPQIPSSRWMKYFGLSRISHISRNSSPKVSKGKENGALKTYYIPPRKPSITLRSSPQQTQDNHQQRRAVLDYEEEPTSSPSELLYAALKKPVLYESGFSVLRTVPVPHDQKYQEFYSQPDGVQQQVIETLKQILGVAAASNSRVEYVMGRLNCRAQFEPTILICCTDRQQRQALNIYFKTHPWTMTGFSHSVEIDPVVLASGGVDLKPLRGNVVRAHDPANRETICGLAGKVFVEKKSDASSSGNPAHPMARLTLGGLICVGHRSLYALTTAHPFSEGSKSDSDNTSNNTISSDHVLFGTVYEFEYLDCDASQGPERKSPSSNRAWDWALLQVDQPAYYKPNSFHPQLPDAPPVFIESHLTAEELSDGEVWVCSASKGPRLAMLYADRTLMMVGNSIFEARSIGLAEELADGDSGSWVVREGKLCGYIYSRILHRPWAYMLLIDSVFQEISRVLSHSPHEFVSVEVATRAEVERLSFRELPPGQSKAASRGEDVFENSTTVLASKPSDTSNVPASDSDTPMNQHGLSEELESYEYPKSSKKLSGRTAVDSTGGPDPNSEHKQSRVNLGDQELISTSKPSDIKTTPATGSDPPKTQDKVPEDTKDKEYITRDLITVSGEIRPSTVPNETDRLKLAKLARKSEMDVILPTIIHFFNTSSDQDYRYHTTEDSRLTERVRQLFQRLQLQTSTFRESGRKIVTRHGDATTFILLKSSSSSERRLPDQLLSDVCELITRNLTRALGIPRTEILFKTLASIDNRLHSLADDAKSIVEIFQKDHLIRILLRLNYRTKLSKFEEYLNGLEISMKHLQWMLSEQAVYQSVQEAYINSSSPSSSELQFGLYKTLLQICTDVGSIDPVVGLALPYPTIEAYSTIPLESRQTVSFFCMTPQQMHNYLWSHLHSQLIDENRCPHWQRRTRDSIPVKLAADMASWWSCNGRPKNGSDELLTTSGDLNTLALKLGDPELWLGPHGTTINSVNSAPVMVFNKISVTPGTVMMNVEEYFAQLNDQLYAKGSQHHFMGTPSSELSEFALKLSYSILLSSSTPWVQLDWSWDNILAMREGENSPTPGEIHVVIVQKLHTPDEGIQQAFLWAEAKSDKLILGAFIERLGFALIDLAFGKKLCSSGNDGKDDDTMYKMAMRLCDTGQIAMRAGQIYEKVVKACLTQLYRSGSEIKTINPSRPDFQIAAYEAILSPLHDLAFPRKSRDATTS